MSWSEEGARGGSDKEEKKIAENILFICVYILSIANTLQSKPKADLISGIKRNNFSLSDCIFGCALPNDSNRKTKYS